MAVPLSLLHTFVIAARCGRMRDAAAQMGLTPGAISQRMRTLEASLGTRLFRRTQAGVELTPAGAALFARLDAAFRQIETVGAGLETPPARQVRVSTMGSFAASWLVPRLPGFSRRFPGIDVALETEGRLVDLKHEPVDLAIRHGLGDYPGLEAVWLMAPELIVVASPALLEAHPPIEGPADCLRFPLLHDIDRDGCMDRADWRLWFEAQGVRVPGRLTGPSFSDDHLMIRAAVAGQGLALVRDVYAGDDLRRGTLVRAIDAPWPMRFAYYAVATAQALQKPAVRKFRDWLAAEAGSKTGAEAGATHPSNC